MRIAFSVPGVPTAKGRPKFARRGAFVHAYTPSKTATAEQTLVARALQFRPEKPLEGPLHVVAHFVMPIPDSWPKKRKAVAAGGVMPHVVKPDLDNLVKLLKDALNGVFWLDDKQIFSLTAAKVYGPTPETQVEILTRGDEIPF